MRKCLVLKKQADQFSVELESGEVLICCARKNLKKDGIFVGDRVFLDDDNAISKIDKRKNLLVRPPMANLDKMFIVVAPVPKPDFYTVDKLLLFCKLSNIKPIICINKSDLNIEECQKIENLYKDLAKTFVFSSLDQSVDVLLDEIDGICVLSGQSAVGKSSIINALKKELVSKVDTFSKKIERGKQTTRTVQIFKFGKNKYLADTAGFSKLDERLLDLKENEIKDYYDDFLKFAHECKYKSCLHTTDKDCGICKAVKAGQISKIRYENYKKMYEIVKNIKKF